MSSDILNSYGVTQAVHVTHGRTYSLSAPVSSKGYISAGRSFSVPYEGDYDLLKTQADSIIQSATSTNHISISLSEVAGGKLAKMTVTYSTYKRDTASSAEDENTAEYVGKSRDNPEYSFEFSEQELSILYHPIFQNEQDSLSKLAATAVGAWVAGASADSIVRDESNGFVCSILQALEHNEALADYIGKNKPRKFIYNFVTAKATYEISPQQAIAAAEGVNSIKKPPGFLGNINFGSNTNWLFSAISYTAGSRCSCTEIYKLSAPGGWDKNVYKSSNS